MKKIAAIILAILVLLSLFAACGKKEEEKPHTEKEAATLASLQTEDGKYRLTFSASISMDIIGALNGREVVITGYMATLSPVSGKFMYLMNLPYQSCPYCKPNTSELSNTMAVYAPEGKTFDFTDGPVKVTGTLETGDFTDEFGYEYNYRIKDAAWEKVEASALSGNILLWQRITEEGLAADIYSMFDYLDFMCRWTEYTAKFDGINESPLYPADVASFKKNQFKVEDSEKYFEDLENRAAAIDETELKGLCEIIEEGKALEKRAEEEIASSNFTYDSSTDKYTLINYEEMSASVTDLYQRFAAWLEKFSA